MNAPAEFERLRASLDAAYAVQWSDEGYEHQRDPVTLTERRDFWALDIGTSGAFLIRKADGAVFCIKGYGRPDYAKGIGYAHMLSGHNVLRCRWARPGQYGMRRDMRPLRSESEGGAK